MPIEQRWLRRQLLVWLLVPLTLLLVADAFVSYRVTLDFSRRAYDRSLIDIAHEIALHLRASAGGLELDMPEAARRVLLTDRSDAIYFAITAADGSLIVRRCRDREGPSRAGLAARRSTRAGSMKSRCGSSSIAAIRPAASRWQ